ncbi:hypothetical protein [Fulvivirga sedimenti]|nr:hypothetical protein [Fulvivirga sedimenti]
MKRQWIIIFLSLILAAGCASSNKRPGKIKPGKPIPCPQKDC